jgi:hypothetical protein
VPAYVLPDGRGRLAPSLAPATRGVTDVDSVALAALMEYVVRLMAIAHVIQDISALIVTKVR